MLSLNIATILTATAFNSATRSLVLGRGERCSSPQCTIAVFGASGRTGSEVVLQAMERGEKVSCLVRDRNRLKAPRNHTELGLTKGSMMNFGPSTNENIF